MNATTTTKRVTLLKKITMSEVNGLLRASGGFKPKVHFGAAEDGSFAPVLIMRVAGVVTGKEVGTTNYGPFVRFKGNFAAINKNGDEFRSPSLILPPPADGLTEAAFDAGDGTPVELAFDIMAVHDAGDRGYKFQVQPLMQQTQADPLDTLLATVGQNFALPAPVANTPEAPQGDGGTVAEAPQAEKGKGKSK